MSSDTQNNPDLRVLQHLNDLVRRRLKHQSQLMRDLDNKSLQVFRSTFLLGGFLLTAASLLDPSILDPGTTINYWIGLGGVFITCSGFVCAIIFSFMASRISMLHNGPDLSNLEDLLDDLPGEEEWHRDAVKDQLGRLDENSNRLDHDADLLMYSQISLVGVIVGILIFIVTWF